MGGSVSTLVGYSGSEGHDRWLVGKVGDHGIMEDGCDSWVLSILLEVPPDGV